MSILLDCPSRKTTFSEGVCGTAKFALKLCLISRRYNRTWTWSELINSIALYSLLAESTINSVGNFDGYPGLRVQTRQGTSIHYQLCYLDLVATCQLNQLFSNKEAAMLSSSNCGFMTKKNGPFGYSDD